MASIGFSQKVLIIPGDNDNHYLSATAAQGQSLCYNKEGWGPISPDRYDFTPCFLDVWLLAVSTFGIVFGAAALWYLLRKCTPVPVTKNWHFWTKLVSVM
jgi:ATP-binding cassette subfamily C (CFTR/MRP) protein 1